MSGGDDFTDPSDGVGLKHPTTRPSNLSEGSDDAPAFDGHVISSGQDRTPHWKRDSSEGSDGNGPGETIGDSYREQKTEAHLETPWWYWAAFLVLWTVVLFGVIVHV